MRAHVCETPIAIASTPLVSPSTSTGTLLLAVVPSPSSPKRFCPQHLTLPAVVRAQLCRDPTATSDTPVSGLAEIGREPSTRTLRSTTLTDKRTPARMEVRIDRAAITTDTANAPLWPPNSCGDSTRRPWPKAATRHAIVQCGQELSSRLTFLVAWWRHGLQPKAYVIYRGCAAAPSSNAPAHSNVIIMGSRSTGQYSDHQSLLLLARRHPLFFSHRLRFLQPESAVSTLRSFARHVHP